MLNASIEKSFKLRETNQANQKCNQQRCEESISTKKCCHHVSCVWCLQLQQDFLHRHDQAEFVHSKSDNECHQTSYNREAPMNASQTNAHNTDMI